ncbi:MAG: arsenate reductase ArsC [Acidobacteriota bacterium]
MSLKHRLLFLCTGNSARSQMAEGLLRHAAGDRFEVFSAGTRPTAVRAEAVAVMAELGIDLSTHRSKNVDEFVDRKIDSVISVCDNAREACPVFHGAVTHLHWPFEDPAAVAGDEATRLAAFRAIRDQISVRLAHFINTAVT